MLDKLASNLELRQQALLRELEIVHHAIEEIKGAAQDTQRAKDWFERLDKWHQELHELVERLPRVDQG